MPALFAFGEDGLMENASQNSLMDPEKRVQTRIGRNIIINSVFSMVTLIAFALICRYNQHGSAMWVILPSTCGLLAGSLLIPPIGFKQIFWDWMIPAIIITIFLPFDSIDTPLSWILLSLYVLLGPIAAVIGLNCADTVTGKHGLL